MTRVTYFRLYGAGSVTVPEHTDTPTRTYTVGLDRLCIIRRTFVHAGPYSINLTSRCYYIVIMHEKLRVSHRLMYPYTWEEGSRVEA
jgi:hypothetical protein